MTEFVGYLCWSPDVVTKTIATEAAAPSDAVLLATHTPLKIHRRVGGRVGSTATITEKQLVKAFLESPANEGVVVTPILGESGTGKSHLIRWANANIPRVTGRHVISLQKTETSLGDVVEALLLGRRGPLFDDIRVQLTRLGSSVSLDTLKRGILDQLAEVLRTAETQDPFEKAVVGERGLYLLFHDPVFREYLLRDGAFLSRRAEHALNGREADAPDVPLQFTVDDLPLDISDSNIDIGTAAQPTKQAFARLAARPEVQVAAVALMNEYLDVAVMKSANLDVGNIQRAFMEIRRELAGDEIILLIEDIALIQGVRRDLLDAIVEVGVVRGKQEYATIRTLMAVTPGYYEEDLPETFRTRAEASSPVYVVDVDMAGSDESQDATLIDFFGRYLNAARVGKEALEASPRGRVPNACIECAFMEECHATFGKTSDGYGLYPYNEPAALRAIRASAPKEHPNQFNPRRVLARAIKQVLTDQADDLRAGTFPTRAFAIEFEREFLPALSLGTRITLEEQYSGDERDRYTTLLEFWGDRGQTAIPKDVYQAFTIPPLPADFFTAEEHRVKSKVQESGGKTGMSTGGDTVPKSVERKITAIEDWSKGSDLPQDVAAAVRRYVRDAVVSRMDWSHPVMKELTAALVDKHFPGNARSVGIEGTKVSMALSAEPLIKIERTAGNAQFLINLFLIEAGLLSGATSALLELDRLADQFAQAAQDLVVAGLGATDSALTSVAATLVRGAALCGHLESSTKTKDLVDAVFWTAAESDREDTAIRTKSWTDGERSYLIERVEVVQKFKEYLGASQGTGEVHAVDAVRLSKILRDAVRIVDGDYSENLPDWGLAADRRLRLITAAVAGQIADWQILLTNVRHLLPADISYVDTVDAVAMAAKDGVKPGVVPVQDLQALESDLRNARALRSQSIQALERTVDRARQAEGLEQLMLVGTDFGGDPPAIWDFLQSTAVWVESGISMAQSKVGSGQVDLDREIDSVLTSWFETVGNPEDENGE